LPRPNWIRAAYLYLAALIGLVLVTIGGVQLEDMGLRAFVFRAADARERLEMAPPAPPFRPDDAAALAQRPGLSAEERRLLQQWGEEYRRWQEGYAKVDMVRAQRARQASGSLSMILVGLPLFLFHWRTIQREAREGKMEDGAPG
jgi:hypothetical protein